MNSTSRPPVLPEPTIKRYPLYLRLIKRKVAEGATLVSSAALAEGLGLDPVLARKDLAMAGVPGRPRRGYPARELLEAIRRALGWDVATGAALVGVGSLGRALLGYQGFEEQKLSISAAFDASPSLVGANVHGVTVRSMAELPRTVKARKLELGILTVPNAAAQDCADRLVAAGVRGIWNFTATPLAVPAGVFLQNVDLAQSLAVLSHRIAACPPPAVGGK